MAQAATPPCVAASVASLTPVTCCRTAIGRLRSTVTTKRGTTTSSPAIGTDATLDENGELKGVKAGQTVIINAKQGYKIRKVEAKKTEKTTE